MLALSRYCLNEVQRVVVVEICGMVHVCCPHHSPVSHDSGFF